MKAERDGDIFIASNAEELYEQSGYGRVLRDKTLRLDAKEALYLAARGKLDIGKSSYDKLLSEFSKQDGFLRSFIVYRDIRERGYVITTGAKDFRIFPRGQKPGKGHSKFLMRVMSERDLIDFSEIIQEATTSANMRKQFILAVLDDEHEITYYEIRLVHQKPSEIKEIPNNLRSEIAGLPSFISEDGKGTAETLENLWFGTMLGPDKLFLSPIETAWLLKNGYLKTNPEISPEDYISLASERDSEFYIKLVLYSHLRDLGYYPRSGYKYGHHFRVYTKADNHSEMLAHAVDSASSKSMSEISKSVRLAHSVKKRMIFACIDGKNITEVEFARIKM